MLINMAIHYIIDGYFLIEDLQKEQGAVLPSCQVEFEDNLEVQLRIKAKQEVHSWGWALEQYGDDIAVDGIDCILQKYFEMTKGDAWKDCLSMYFCCVKKIAAHCTGC
jgi:hypothetical protein